MNKQLKAITLIESILYLALFSIIFISIIQFVFTVVDSNRLAAIANELDSNSIFLNEHFQDSFRNSTSVDTGNSVFDDDNGVLQLNKSGGGYIKYSLQDGRIQVDNNGTMSALSRLDFKVDQLSFAQVQNMNSELVGIRVTINFVSNTTPDLTKQIVSSFILPAYE